MEIQRYIGIVGSRQFKNYKQLCRTLDRVIRIDDCLVSGGAVGTDSMAQRYAKEKGLRILIIYPNYNHYGRGATFVRNEKIAEISEKVFAFYAKGQFGMGGTANTVSWCRKLGRPFIEEEEYDEASWETKPSA